MEKRSKGFVLDKVVKIDPILLQGKGQSIVKNEIIEKALRHWPIVLENMLE